MNMMGTGKTGSRGGKGFYIVLLLCTAVLGTAGWIAVKGAGTDVEEAAEVIREYETEAYVEADSEETEETVAVMAETAAETETAAAQPVSYICPVEGDVQKPYSSDRLMYDSTMRDWRVHEGIDYACADGTSVVAAANGTVLSVENDALLGTTVTIQHADGVETIYANMASEPYVHAGDTVYAGQIIGCVGGTAIGESAEASHLHFAVRCSGVWQNPDDYIA